jgi:hypothetical protein
MNNLPQIIKRMAHHWTFRLALWAGVATMSSTSAIGATLRFEDHFDGLWGPAVFKYKTDDSGVVVSWPFTLSSSVKTHGSHSARIENRGWIGTSEDGGKHRRFVQPGCSTISGLPRYATNAHHWFGYAFYLDAGWDGNIATGEGTAGSITFQLNRGPGGPETELILRGNRELRITRKWNGGSSGATDWSGTLDAGVWYYVVYHKYRSWNSDGRHRLWLWEASASIPQQPVMDITGANAIDYAANGADGDPNPMLSIGTYFGATPRNSKYVLHFDTLRVAEGTLSDGFDTVNPAQNDGIPAAPSNLTATTASSSQIDLAWTDNSSDETGFEVDRALNSGFSSGLAVNAYTTGANATGVAATGLSGNTTYYFRARATNANGDSANSNTANATTATDAAGPSITVNDNATGTGLNQFEYSGTWSSTSSETGAYQGDLHYSNVTNNFYQVDFSGTQVKIYTKKSPGGGIAAVSIDGGAETDVDHYAATATQQQLVYTSPTLAAGNHTIKVRVKGTKNALAANYYVNADRVDIITGSIAYWPFDGDASDASGNGNGGTLVNGATFATGKTGQALSLNGSDQFVRIGDPADGDLDMGTGNFTICAWVKTGAHTASNGIIVGKRGSSANVGYDVRIASGKLGLYLKDADDGSHGVYQSTSATYSDNAWHHVAVVVNRSGNAQFYKDGAADGTAGVSSHSASLDNGLDLNIGISSSDGSTGGGDFNGLIDGVQIYKRALSAGEISAIYNSGL